MATRPGSRRIRSVVAGLILAIAASIGSVALVAAARPNQDVDFTACAAPNGKSLLVTATWSGVQVDAWSYFVESTDGSGGVFQPVPAPGTSGTVSTTVGGDVDNIQSVSVTLFRAAGPNFRDVASASLTQSASGWPTC